MRSTYRCTLKHQSHQPEELCAFLIDGYQYPVENWSLSERTAVQEWNAWLASWPDLCERNKDIVPSAEEMNKALKLVSVIFFCDKLDRCSFVWTKNMCYKPDGTLQPDMPRLGHCKASGAGDTFKTLLELDPADFKHMSKHEDIIASKVGTLLHECVHAFIFLYSCTTGDFRKCPNPVCIDKACYNWGATGHGVNFIQVATHVEALHKQITGVAVHLSIPVSINLEFGQSTTFVGVRPQDLHKCHPECYPLLTAFYKKSVLSRGLSDEEAGMDQLDVVMKKFNVMGI